MKNYRKTYQCMRTIHLDTFVNVDGNQIGVSFKGGTLSPRKIFGKFITSDLKIQKALEDRGGFGSTYKLVRREEISGSGPDVQTEEPKPEPKLEPKPETEPEPDLDEDVDVDLTPKGPTVMEAITTVQAAREHLLNKITGLTGTRLKNKKEVLEVAEEYNYKFPNI